VRVLLYKNNKIGCASYTNGPKVPQTLYSHFLTCDMIGLFMVYHGQGLGCKKGSEH
jgi:hypothetical protein